MKRRYWILAGALAAATPVAAQMGVEQDLQIADVEALRRAVEDLRANMLRPGPRVQGWDRGGVDPDAELRARGADRFFFLNRDAEGVSVGIITTRPFSDFAPAAWRIVDSYGTPDASLPDPQLDFAALSPRYVMGVRAQFERRRDVNCMSGISSALLYEVRGAPARPGDEALPIMFRLILLALEGQELCVRTDGDPLTGYRSRVFTPDGVELPEMSDPDGVTTIVPAAPIDQLIEPPPPRATEHS